MHKVYNYVDVCSNALLKFLDQNSDWYIPITKKQTKDLLKSYVFDQFKDDYMTEIILVDSCDPSENYKSFGKMSIYKYNISPENPLMIDDYFQLVKFFDLVYREIDDPSIIKIYHNHLDFNDILTVLLDHMPMAVVKYPMNYVISDGNDVLKDLWKKAPKNFVHELEMQMVEKKLIIK